MMYAAKVAPGYKGTVVFILLILVVMLVGASIFMEFIKKDFSNTAAVLGSTVGSCIGYFVSKDGKGLENI